MFGVDVDFDVDAMAVKSFSVGELSSAHASTASVDVGELEMISLGGNANADASPITMIKVSVVLNASIF